MKKIILVPSNLGLNPLYAGHIPGTWRAPSVLMERGLKRSFAAYSTLVLPVPDYSSQAEAGTNILNGHKLRNLNLRLADEVHKAQKNGLKPIVIGGDCAILPGVLAGSRRSGSVALIHIDGHSDFRHPGNWEPESGKKPGAAAGMDLALVTGRGEPLLTQWPGIKGPLIPDEAVVQLGEREGLDEDFEWPDIYDTEIDQINIFDALKLEDNAVISRIYHRLDDFPDWRYWIHIDVDVLDKSEMPAVDCPGIPGLSSQRLIHIGRNLFVNSRCCGITVTIFDPDLDPTCKYADLVVNIIDKITGEWAN